MASILGKMCFSFPFDRPAGGTVHLFEAFTSVVSFLSFFFLSLLLQANVYEKR